MFERESTRCCVYWRAMAKDLSQLFAFTFEIISNSCSCHPNDEMMLIFELDDSPTASMVGSIGARTTEAEGLGALGVGATESL